MLQIALATPRIDQTLPAIRAVAERYPDRTIFTRFVPPESLGEMPGTWQRYYERWQGGGQQGGQNQNPGQQQPRPGQGGQQGGQQNQK